MLDPSPWPGRLVAGCCRALRSAHAMAGAAIATAVVSVVGLPAGAQLFKPSVADQVKLGDEAAAKILTQYHEINDARTTRIRTVGSRLVNALSEKDRGPWNYRFHLLDSKTINAFALPGGNIFLFSGLVDRLPNDDELAAVMGHEMTHVRKEHWAKAYSQQVERQTLIGAIADIARLNGTLRSVASGAEGLYTLKYSRSEEDQADAGGLQDMVQAHYNPQGMLDLFAILQKAAGSGPGVDFLSDHPLTSERIKRTRQRIAALHQSP